MGERIPLVQISFTGGIETRVRDELVDPAKQFLAMENCIQDKIGAVSKRKGYESLGRQQRTNSNVTSGRAVLTYRENGPVLIDGQKLYAWSEGANTSERFWKLADRVPECVADRFSLAGQSLFSLHGFDVAYAGGYYCVVTAGYDYAASQTEVLATIYDATTLSVVRGPESLAISSMQPSADLKVISQTLATSGGLGALFIVVYHKSTDVLEQRRLMVNSRANIDSGWAAAVSVATNFGNAGTFDIVDMANLTNPTQYALVYGNNSGGSSAYTVKRLTSAGVVSQTATINSGGLPSASDAGCAIGGASTDTLWVSWTDVTTPNTAAVIGYDPNDLTIVKATPLTVIAPPNIGVPNIQGLVATTSGAGVLVTSQRGNAQSDLVYQHFETVSGAVSLDGFAQVRYHVQMWTRPFEVNGRFYVGATHQEFENFTNGQNLFWIIDITDETASETVSRPVATIAPRLCLNAFSAITVITNGMPGHAVEVDDGKIALLAWVRRTGGNLVGTVIQGSLELCVLDWGHKGRWRPATVGDGLYIGGGVPSVFDAIKVRECGFLSRPDKPVLADSSIAGNPNGTYKYVLIFEQQDSNGDIHQSAPSDASASILVASSKIDVTVRGLTITNRYSNLDSVYAAVSQKVWGVLYRTKAGGATYLRLPTSLATLSAGGHPLHIAGGDSLTLRDNVADASLGALLYTQPGTLGTALPRQCPPSFSAITQHQGRIIGVGDDGVTLWPSGQRVVGEGLWWNDLLSFTLAEDGRITALASDESYLYVFKRNSIFVVDGDGAADNGAGQSYRPRKLSSHVGCIDPRSVAVCTAGVLFQSHRGIELITRSMQVQWLGEAVRDLLSTYPICVAASVDSLNNRALFEMVKEDHPLNGTPTVNDGGTCLEYDFATSSWSRFRRTGADGVTDAAANGASMIQVSGAPTYHWVNSSGYMHRESSSSYLDPSSEWVTQQLETGWFKMASIQGWQRIDALLLLFKKFTDHNLIVDMQVDYDTSAWTTLRTFTRSEINALARSQVEAATNNDATGMAVRFRLRDATPTGGSIGTGQGAAWITATLEGEVEKGRNRTPSAAR